MKPNYFLVILFAVALFTASCTTAPEPAKTAPAQTTPAAQSSANAEQEVRKTIDDWFEADKKQDKDWYMKHFADNILSTDFDGNMYGKKESMVFDPTDKFESHKLEDVKIQPQGDIVFVSYKVTVKGATKAENYSGVYRLTTAWKKNAGDWQLVARHISKVKEKK